MLQRRPHPSARPDLPLLLPLQAPLLQEHCPLAGGEAALGGQDGWGRGHRGGMQRRQLHGTRRLLLLLLLLQLGWLGGVGR